jgi:integrase
VADLSWSELDLDAALWVLPAARSKNGKAHEIPLSPAAVSLLRALPRQADSELVFTTNGRTPVSGWSRTKHRFDARMAALAKTDIPNWRLHDLRRTAASGMARLGQPVHVVEAVLNHRDGAISGIAAIYNRYSYALEKRHALESWAAAVERLCSGEPAGKVVALRAAS